MLNPKSTAETDQMQQIIHQLSVAAIGLNAANSIVVINEAGLNYLELSQQPVTKLKIEDLIPDVYSLMRRSREDQQNYMVGLAKRGLADPFNAKLSFSFFKRDYPINEQQVSTLIFVEALNEAQFDELNDQQSMQFDMLSCYAGGIAHDLNNILNVITGHLEILQLSAAQDLNIKKRVCSALKGVERGRVLSARLGHLAYHEQKNASPCYLNKIIQDNLELLQELVSNSVEISIDLAGHLLPVDLDASYFIDVLINLCMNANNAMAGQGRIVIKTFLASAQELNVTAAENQQIFIGLSIEDSGCGIPKVIQDKIFSPFFTTKMNNKGTGLGLSLVQSYMHNHNGFITLKSKENEGSCFYLYFPALQSSKVVNNEKEPNMEIEQKLNGKHILVVDDEAPILHLLKEFLGIYGLNVKTANSGSEGLDLAQNEDFDLILSDLVMPGKMDGAEFASLLLQQKPDASIIFMSGYTDNKLIDKEELANIPIISKPFRKKELLSQMDVVLT